MGGTNLRAAAVGEDGTMLDKAAGSTPLEPVPTRLSPTWYV